MVKTYFKKVNLVGYDIINSDKGKFIKLYLLEQRERKDNTFGDSVFEIFENFADWKDFVNKYDFNKHPAFQLEGIYKNYKFYPTNIVDIAGDK